ncbi:MAG: hypothetical protein ACTSU2_16400 [Promethearchaeota archaeon]
MVDDNKANDKGKDRDNEKGKETGAPNSNGIIASSEEGKIKAIELTPTSQVKKKITIDGNVYKTLSKIRNDMSKKLGGRITFNMVIQTLIHDRIDLENMKKEFEQLKQEMDETQEYIKNMLELALQTPKTLPSVIAATGYIPTANLSGNTQIPPSPPSPPKPPKAAIPKKLNYVPPKTGDLKRDYVVEIKQLFTGTILKPSEILKITKPKHMNSKINFIEPDKDENNNFNEENPTDLKDLSAEHHNKVNEVDGVNKVDNKVSKKSNILEGAKMESEEAIETFEKKQIEPEREDISTEKIPSEKNSGKESPKKKSSKKKSPKKKSSKKKSSKKNSSKKKSAKKKSSKKKTPKKKKNV